MPELVQIGLELLSGSSLLHAYLLDVIESLVGVVESGRFLLYLLWGLAWLISPVLGFITFTERTMVPKLVKEVHVVVGAIKLAGLLIA